jgi:hypothetical protein
LALCFIQIFGLVKFRYKFLKIPEKTGKSKEKAEKIDQNMQIYAHSN